MKFELTTDRLILKVLSAEDAPAVFDFYMRNKGLFEKYEPVVGEGFYSEDYHRKVLEFEYKSILKLGMVRYFIFEKDNPSKIIGTLSFRNITRHFYSCCTVGYKMDQDYWRKGYCYEALKASIPEITSGIGIHRIEALVLPDNIPSLKLLEKLGFEQEGLLRDKIELNGVRRDHIMLSYIADN